MIGPFFPWKTWVWFFLFCILVTCIQIDIKSSLYNAFVQYKDKRHATKVFKWIFTALFRNRRFILDGIIQWIASEIFHALVYVTIDPQSIPKLPKIKNGKTPTYFDFVIPKIWQILKHLLLFLRQFPLA